VKLAEGVQVNPNVRLVRPLGEGAMGEVWVGAHLTLGTEVAVKFISAELAASQPDIVTRFEREAAVAARIKSPHVVQTFDRGVTDDGTPFIVMELLEGESLWSRLGRTETLSLRETAQVVTQVGRALRRAHELGIIHRDIKPDNVFVAENDEGLFCKVLDFGIAKQAKLPQLEGLTSTGMLVGTPEYMSPEQFMNSADVDFQADLWALAVTAYQCLTGELPFPGKTLGQLCAQLLAGEFPPASSRRSSLGGDVDGWFARALAREPSARFPDVRAFSSAFVALLGAEGRGFDDTLANSVRGELPSRAALPPSPAAPVPTLTGVATSSPAPTRRTAGRAALAIAVGCGLGLGALVLAARFRVDGDAPRAVSSTLSSVAGAPSVVVPVAAASSTSSAAAAAAAAPGTTASVAGAPAMTAPAVVSSAPATSANAVSLVPPAPVAAPASVPNRPAAAAPIARPAATPTPGNYGF